MTLGIHTDMNGGSTQPFANSLANCIARIYAKQRAMPMPMCPPMPPRTLRDDSDTPMSVSMNVEMG